MRQIIFSIAGLLILPVFARASEASIYIEKTRAELIELYAPVLGVERNDRLEFNADIGGSHCVIRYAFVREKAISAFCTIDNACLTNQREALARWSKILKAFLAGRTATAVQLKIDGIQVMGEDRYPTEPTVIGLMGAWDEKYEFVAAFGGPSPKAAARTELFTMVLCINPKDKTPPGDFVPLMNSEQKEGANRVR